MTRPSASGPPVGQPKVLTESPQSGPRLFLPVDDPQISPVATAPGPSTSPSWGLQTPHPVKSLWVKAAPSIHPALIPSINRMTTSLRWIRAKANSERFQRISPRYTITARIKGAQKHRETTRLLYKRGRLTQKKGVFHLDFHQQSRTGHPGSNAPEVLSSLLLPRRVPNTANSAILKSSVRTGPEPVREKLTLFNVAPVPPAPNSRPFWSRHHERAHNPESRIHSPISDWSALGRCSNLHRGTVL